MWVPSVGETVRDRGQRSRVRERKRGSMSDPPVTVERRVRKRVNRKASKKDYSVFKQELKVVTREGCSWGG